MVKMLMYCTLVLREGTFIEHYFLDKIAVYR